MCQPKKGASADKKLGERSQTNIWVNQRAQANPFRAIRALGTGVRIGNTKTPTHRRGRKKNPK